MSARNVVITIVFFFFLPPFTASAQQKIIIAENGAGAQLIENTLAATTLAMAQGVEYLELPVVMSADNQLILYDDITLDRLTNVATLFPERSRGDGKHYVIDFTLDEIRQLRLKNVFESDPFALTLGIPTLQEELSLIRKLKTSLSVKTGIIVEIKCPWFFKDAGKDISREVLDLLNDFHFDEDEKIYIQSFDPEELQRLHTALMPQTGVLYPLIQMIGRAGDEETKQQQSGTWQPYDYEWLFTNLGLRIVSKYAAIIGLPQEKADVTANTTYIDGAHKYGLQVFLYSISDNQESLMDLAEDFPSLLRYYYKNIGIDGIYTASYLSAQNYNMQPVIKEKQKTGLPPFFSNLNLSPLSGASKNPDRATTESIDPSVDY
ncbi:MAG: glycerophosphodiester phosphodiesterase [Desulfobulbaceae bacterium]|nr:glycerophosphodiester phosphodiesterase [Desulfobulbaceae bacterium]